MQQVTLNGVSFPVSRFAFGTAGLLNVGTARRRAALLDAAFEHGFTHFDTAPYYGFGVAERDLAPLLARHGAATVTTKVGLYSPGGESQPDWLVASRKASGRLVAALSRPHVDWSVSHARAALRGSLRRLERDRIDLYMLHEPDLAMLAADEWLRFLEDEVAAGHVLHFGIATNAARLEPFLAARSPLAEVVQTIDSLEMREADRLIVHGRPLQITYGYVSAAIRRHGRADVPAILSQALARNAAGAVIVSTGKISRLPQYAALASR